MYAASRYETGSNLPTDKCSGVWDFCERVELTKHGMGGFGVNQDTVEREVRRKGWYVWGELPRESRQSIPDIRPEPREQTRPPSEPQTAPSQEHVATALPPKVPPTRHVPASALETAAARTSASLQPGESPTESRKSTADIKPASRERTRPPIEPQRAPSQEHVATTLTPKTPPMRQPAASAAETGVARSSTTLTARHQVVWFDIPVRDIDRAVRFYSAVLGAHLKKEQAGPGIAMAMLPHADGGVGGCLVQNADARPSETGPLLYLNAHGRLDDAIRAVEMYGGTVLSPRHSIAPFGFRAIVLDSEGNRIALHSQA